MEVTTAAAAIAGAVAIARPVVNKGVELIEKLLGEPCKVAGGMLADHLYVWQWKNRVEYANQVQEILDRDRIAARIVPPSFLLPILEAVGNVDDVDLRKMWVRLTASGIADDNKQHPAFAETLRRMNGADARYLERYAHHSLSGSLAMFRWSGGVGQEDAIVARMLALNLFKENVHVEVGELLGQPIARASVAGVHLTAFGNQFIAAVTEPNSSEAPGPSPR